LLTEGYRVVGFDIEAHDYGDGKRYPAQLVIQDVLTIHGSQFKDAALIVASPPCQEYSYMAMPWGRAKAIAAEYRSGKRDVKNLRALFDTCFRIQREAIEAAGHFIPMVVENVRGAQPWVGKARWNFGSYYLWGDVPALMPITMPRSLVKGRSNFHFQEKTGLPSPSWHGAEHEFSVQRYVKTVGHLNIRDGHTHTRHLTNQAEHGAKFSQTGDAFDGTPRDKMLGEKGPAAFSSKSSSRKAASAAIAKIPLALARWIAKVYKPKTVDGFTKSHY
jgi:hypothetical protein